MYILILMLFTSNTVLCIVYVFHTMVQYDICSSYKYVTILHWK